MSRRTRALQGILSGSTALHSAYGPRRGLTNAHIEQRQPILHRLQREAYQNQANAEHAHTLLGHMVRAPLDERREWHRNSRDQSDHQPAFTPTASAFAPLPAAKALKYPVTT